MRQFHARFHFWRVSLADMRRAEILDKWRAQWVGDIREAMETERYKRLCRIVALYRVAGYLNPQEL